MAGIDRIRCRRLAAEHDDVAGTARGPNTLMCFSLGGFRFCHLGDLGQQALRPDLMLAYLVWIGAIGYALNVLLVVAQKRLFGRAALSGDGR